MSRRGKVEDPHDPPETLEEFYEPPVGHWRFGAFPPDRFVVGMAFEVGGAYEDWGWQMWEKTYVPGTGPGGEGRAAYELKTFCSARRLPDLLAKADEKMRELGGR